MSKNVMHKLGLHPIVAFGMIIIDMMLFGPDSGGVSWLLSAGIAALLVLPCILMQRFAYKDQWLIAITKGFFVGIVTGIPTPLPAILTILGGIMGLYPFEKNKEIEEENKKSESPPE